MSLFNRTKEPEEPQTDILLRQDSTLSGNKKDRAARQQSLSLKGESSTRQHPDAPLQDPHDDFTTIPKKKPSVPAECGDRDDWKSTGHSNIGYVLFHMDQWG